MSKQPDDKTPNGKALPLATLMEILENGVVDVEHGTIRWSSNYTFLMEVGYQDHRVMAIYKPQHGERPLWDFPDGTLCYRERASYVTSDALGWNIVPPTALREGPRGLGSLQFFVDHDPNHHYFEFDETMLPQLERLALFDVLVNNADRKGGHCIVDDNGHLWGIDHGLTFHPANKLRTVVWDFADEPVAEYLLEAVEKLLKRLQTADDDYRQLMCQLISDVEMQAFIHRMEQILQTRHYPIPGVGPNYPWPPV